jgi:hypothetical protein
MANLTGVPLPLTTLLLNHRHTLAVRRCTYVHVSVDPTHTLPVRCAVYVRCVFVQGGVCLLGHRPVRYAINIQRVSHREGRVCVYVRARARTRARARVCNGKRSLARSLTGQTAGSLGPGRRCLASDIRHTPPCKNTHWTTHVCIYRPGTCTFYTYVTRLPVRMHTVKSAILSYGA